MNIKKEPQISLRLHSCVVGLKLLLGALLFAGWNIIAQEEEIEKPLFDPHGLSLTIGGNGSRTTKGEPRSIFGANIGIAQTGHWGLPFQIGVRQTLDYEDVVDEKNRTILSTKLFGNMTLFTIAKKVDIVAGFNIGIVYGNTPLLWQAAPEAGFRWWLGKRTAVLWRVDYPFDLNNGRALNVLNYFIGFQVSL